MYEVGQSPIYIVIEDYKNADENMRRRIVEEFCRKLWALPVRRRTRTVMISYETSEDLLPQYQALFKKYESISYKAPAKVKTLLDSWEILRQKLNNLFFEYCDSSICSDTRYVECLREPKRQYFAHVTGSIVAPAEAISEMIDAKLKEAEELCRINTMRKLSLSWVEYQGFVQKYLLRVFDNYVPLDLTENTLVNSFDFMDEDMYAIKYIGTSIAGYLKNARRERLGIVGRGTYLPCPTCGIGFIKEGGRKRTCPVCAKRPEKKKAVQVVCAKCGILFSVGAKSRTAKWCPECRKEVQREQTRRRVALLRERRCNAFK